MADKKVFDAIGHRKVFFTIPLVIIGVALICLCIFGLEVDVVFKGGTLIKYSYSGEVDNNEVKAIFEGAGKGSVNVTSGSAFNSDLETITVSFTSNEGLSAELQKELTDSLIEKFPENNLELIDSQDVTPSAGATFFLKCLVAVIFTFIVLVIYIAIRFRKIGGWSAGVFAIVALLHDVLIVFASFIFFRMSIDANFMAVILTVLGYSINNTIVIYDRIRENRNLYGNKIGFRELVNTSISQSFTRSVNTTVTTACAVLVICVVTLFFGVDSIISFAFPMLVGIVFGFYSSMYLSGPLWVTWQEYKAKKKTGGKSKAKA